MVQRCSKKTHNGPQLCKLGPHPLVRFEEMILDAMFIKKIVKGSDASLGRPNGTWQEVTVKPGLSVRTYGAQKDHINISIVTVSLVSPLILGLKTRMRDPFVCVVLWAS